MVLQPIGAGLLTEQEISRSWRILFRHNELSESTFARADALLEELRPESPLRHRLGAELHELRKRQGEGLVGANQSQPEA